MSDLTQKSKTAAAVQSKPDSRYVTKNSQFRAAVKPPAPVKPDPLKLKVAMEGFSYGLPRGKNKV